MAEAARKLAPEQTPARQRPRFYADALAPRPIASQPSWPHLRWAAKQLLRLFVVGVGLYLIGWAAWWR